MKQKKVASRKAPKTKTKTKKQSVVFSGSTDAGPRAERTREERLRDQCAALGVMASAINARLDAQVKRDWALAKISEYDEIRSVQCGENATRALRDVLDEGVAPVGGDGGRPPRRGGG
jgi:hypothetical protein